MKYLIVNADDFGASRGVNRGVLEAHHDGIVTSASLFVDRPGGSEAAARAREVPGLSVGLHAELDRYRGGAIRTELEQQLRRFEELMGRPPTHLDSHHNIHRAPDVRPEFLAVASERRLLVRDFSVVRYVSSFYGQLNGRPNPQRISVEGLVHVLKTRLHDGVNELGCHPGYADEELVSRYTTEREHELRTLCDPSVRDAIRNAGIVLVNFIDVPRLFGTATA